MKRGTPTHPKTDRLAERLGLRKFEAVGILECLWHFTAQYAKRGDIGKWSDEDIARQIGWDNDATKLIEALVYAGFVDRCQVNRLVVHDWQYHCDQTVSRSKEVENGFAVAVPSDNLGDASEQLAETSQPKALSHSLKPKPRESPTPDGVLPLIDAWNSLPRSMITHKVRREPPSDAARKGWKRIQSHREPRDALSDPKAVAEAIKRATFCHGQGWFRFEWLFGKNKNHQWNAVKLMEGGFEERGNRGSPRPGPGQVYDPTREGGSL